MCSADTVKSVTVLGQKPHPAATRALFTRLSARRRPSLMGRVTRLRSPQVPPPGGPARHVRACASVSLSGLSPRREFCSCQRRLTPSKSENTSLPQPRS